MSPLIAYFEVNFRWQCGYQQVRKRREDAEAEREEMERLKAEESRLREQQQYGDWQKKEEHFHLKQAKQRSKVSNDQRGWASFNATTHCGIMSLKQCLKIG